MKSQAQSFANAAASYHLVRLNSGAAKINCAEGTKRLSWPARLMPGAVIGNFDGIHLGHLSLFNLLRSNLEQRAAESGKTAAPMLLSFVPHPRRALTGIGRREAVRLAAEGPGEWGELTPFRQKCTISGGLGLSYGCFLRFNQRLRNMTAEQFVADFLISTLGLKMAVVGYDWNFGRNREGDIAKLALLGKKYGLEVLIAPKVEIKSAGTGPARVSSSLVKTALAAGDLPRVSALTGRPYTVSGRVCHGDARGRSIGFPTANLHLPLQLLPPDGVYAAYCGLSGAGAGRFPAVINIGTRPTFDGSQRRVEAHLLDFGAAGSGIDLYGKRLVLEFVSLLRREKRFESVEALRLQIGRDIAAARDVFAGRAT